MSTPIQTFALPASIAKMNRIRTLLTDRAMTVRELAESLPADRRTVNTYIKHMRQEVRIERWTRLMPRNYPIPVYALGADRDARKPRPATKADFARRQRRKIAADAELYMRRRAREKAAEIKPRRDPTVVAMFGEAT